MGSLGGGTIPGASSGTSISVTTPTVTTTTAYAASSSSSTSIGGATTSITPTTTIAASSNSSTRLASTTHTATASPSSLSTSSSSPGLSKVSTSSHVSAGATAGIAVACAAVGAAFALVVMWCVRRSRSKSYSKDSKRHSQRIPRPIRHEKGDERTSHDPAVIAMGRGAKVDLDSFLPQQADDATVKKKLLLLFDQIELHVDNFYGEDNQHLTHEQQSEVSRYATPGLPMPLVALLQTSRRKTTVLKHCLGYHVVQLVASPNTTDCLLPYEISSMLAYFEAHRDATQRDSSRAVAISRWRMLTAYLRPDIFDGDVSSISEFEPHIHDLATKFSNTFNSFSQLQHEEQKLKHLTEVLRTALRFALWLYSQPATFSFRWGPASDGSSGSGHTVVTVPSLLKTYDGTGSKIDPPQVIQALVKRRV